MFRMETPRAVIRVWREETEIKDNYDNTDIAQAVNKIVPALHTPSRLIPLIAAMPRVNAVSVLRSNGRGDDGKPNPGGDGVVFYNDWP